ncbi:insect pheromone-binding family, a10/OS-D domain-containing protein [Phthorimaea operculella]|nr:insect pheromone-binding family, a10/OS-D domain-containing protein [Phthorimaea operculella]
MSSFYESLLRSSAMKFLILISIVALVAADEKYTTENDDLDIESVVSDKDQLLAFYGCFMDTSACNEVMSDFKKDLPEAIQQACAKCTPAQKHILRRFLEVLKEKQPQEYGNFQNKFDADHKYFSNLETAIANA